MPAFVGPILIHAVRSSGAVSVGDVFALSPKHTDKVFFGAGGLNTGDFNVITSDKNATNLFDFDLIDQTKAFNG
ncbi:spore germination protein [Metabacillus sp. JX24]|uniref:spore germination protein n=1 Tax=Metabacillus sp. JX24 TaxID=3240759 RepID=UPI00350FCDE9